MPWVEVDSEVTTWICRDPVKVVFWQVETQRKDSDEPAGQGKTVLPVCCQLGLEVGQADVVPDVAVLGDMLPDVLGNVCKVPLMQRVEPGFVMEVEALPPICT